MHFINQLFYNNIDKNKANFKRRKGVVSVYNV